MTKIKTLKNWNEDKTQRVPIAPRTHVKAVFDDNGNTLDSLLGGQDEKLSELASLLPKLPETKIYNPIIKISEELSGGQSCTASKTNYIRKNNILTAHIETNDAFDTFTFGLGKTAYRGYWLTITDTQIIITSEGDSINEVITHDMLLESIIDVIVDINDEWKGTVRLQSKGVSKIFNITQWVGAGALFAQNNGSYNKKVEVSLYSKDLKSDIWGYGDSYFSFNDSQRWTYHLLNWGYKNVLLDHLPGANSSTMYNALLSDIQLGKPKYILWALGMNDASDTEEVNGTWLSYVLNVVSICEENDITPILCTIPSVPAKSHELKNEWVRNSGYRYIDFAKAVGAQADGTWFEGMLSSDKVHPTTKGAIALASKAICDFTELTNIDP